MSLDFQGLRVNLSDAFTEAITRSFLPVERPNHFKLVELIYRSAGNKEEEFGGFFHNGERGESNGCERSAASPPDNPTFFSDFVFYATATSGSKQRRALGGGPASGGYTVTICELSLGRCDKLLSSVLLLKTY